MFFVFILVLETDLKKAFVMAFQAVMLLCPRAPIQTQEYQEFLNDTVNLASEPPLKIPKPPPLLGVVPPVSDYVDPLWINIISTIG